MSAAAPERTSTEPDRIGGRIGVVRRYPRDEVPQDGDRIGNTDGRHAPTLCDVQSERPGYAALLDPYCPLGYRLAVLALAAAVRFAWYALTRRRTGPAALAIGGLGWLAVLGVVLAAAAPGGSYLATLPALTGAVGGLVSLAGRPDGLWAMVAVTAGRPSASDMVAVARTYPL